MEKKVSDYISKYNFVVNEMLRSKSKTLDLFISLINCYNKYSKIKIIDNGSVIMIDKQMYRIPVRYGTNNEKLKRNFVREFLNNKLIEFDAK